MRKLVISVLLSLSFINLNCRKVYGIDDSSKYAIVYNSVQKSINSGKQEDINDSRKLVNELKSSSLSWSIGEFSKNLDIVQNKILKKICDSIDNCKKNPTQYEINNCRKMILDLDDTSWIGSFSRELDIAQQNYLIRGNICLKYYQQHNSTAHLDYCIKVFNDALKSENYDVKSYAENQLKMIEEYDYKVPIDKVDEVKPVLPDYGDMKAGYIFQDEKFECAVESALNITISDYLILPKGYEMLLEKFRTIKTLNLSGFNIRSIGGIWMLENLEELTINDSNESKNYLCDLSPISSLHHLKKIKGNPICNKCDLSVLGYLHEIKCIDVVHTYDRFGTGEVRYFESIQNASFLLGLKELDYVRLRGFKENDLYVLSYIDSKELCLEYTDDRFIDSLVKNDKVEILRLDKTKIVDFSKFSSMSNLKELYVNDKLVSNFNVKIEDGRYETW